MILFDYQWEGIHREDDLLVSSWPKRAFAVAQLRLLKAKDVVKKLDECTSLEEELRFKIMFNQEMYKYDEILDFRKKLKTATLEVHHSLSDFYDSLLK